ncbi:MAG TPA: DUF3300 domain-containing protein [Rhodocyclaceae bacterium]|nr:DUF3300 domain-containing protein [Rhodocyclaceae bacterium]
MRAALFRILAGIVTAAALIVPTAAYPQAPAPFSAQQLEQMLAPIALYPDPLLGQVLMAATYPLEVVEAARWLEDPGNASLGGDQLAAALQSEDWDPSVKSLLPFPQILRLMNSQLGWTQQLGDAFLAQQAEVMDAVQRLRAQARAAGTLASTPEAVVSWDGTITSIEPANPQIVYVPVYDPLTIYGVWPYPDYPPYYFPYPGYGPLIVGGISFGYAIHIVVPLWGWDNCDWHHHRIRIDDDRFNAIARDGRPRATSPTWEHDPFHRRGVAYRDQRSRQRFLGNPAGSPETRRPYRGFDGAVPIAPPAVRPGIPAPKPPAAREPRREPGRERRPAPPAVPAPPAPPAPARVAPRQAPVQPGQPRPPSGFGDIERGRDVRREAERGRASRGTEAPPARREPAAAPRKSGPQERAPAGRGGRRER